MIIATHERLARLTIADSTLRLHVPQHYLEKEIDTLSLENGRQLTIIRDGIFDLMGVGPTIAEARKELHTHIGNVLKLKCAIYPLDSHLTPADALFNYLRHHAGFEVIADPFPTDFVTFEVIYTY